MEVKESTIEILRELYEDYTGVLESAYCQCEGNEEIIKKVENRLGITAKDST